MKRPRIHVLPDALVNQIAAGEVVENPASVVKELIENALDAGANRVIIEVEGGGLDLIRVTDNGWGMDAEDARLALQRHATSKISQVSDLSSIRTLGFRGEALPSIASVSRLSLETRTDEEAMGTLVAVEEGRVTIRPCACPTGTRVSVRDLFHNVPARLKFQRGERARLAAIRDLVGRTALGWPSCHFTLLISGRQTLDLPPCPRLLDRVVQVFGREAADGLYEFSTDREGIRVCGVAGAPTLARPDPNRIVLLVGGRPVQDAGLRRAVLNAYAMWTVEGRFPLVVVRLDLDPEDVDVNVHPRKTEVRFRDQRAVQAAVFEAVRGVLAKTPWVRTEDGSATVPPTPYPIEPFDPPGPVTVVGLREPGASVPSPSSPLLIPPATSGRFSRLRFVGQVAGTILVCEGEGTLVLVDQHAAHERVLFEQLWEGVRARRSPSETLLIPEVVTLSPSEVIGFDDAASILVDLGFDLEPYSGGAVAIRAVPALLRGRAAGPVVRDCIASASLERVGDGMERLRQVVATLACHSAVRAGDPMGETEVRALLHEMDRVDLAAYCPHGRQAVVSFPIEMVLRWFGR